MMNDIRSYILDQIRTAIIDRGLERSDRTLIQYVPEGTMNARAKIEVQGMIDDGLVEDSVLYQDHKHAYMALTPAGYAQAEEVFSCGQSE